MALFDGFTLPPTKPNVPSWMQEEVFGPSVQQPASSPAFVPPVFTPGTFDGFQLPPATAPPAFVPPTFTPGDNPFQLPPTEHPYVPPTTEQAYEPPTTMDAPQISQGAPAESIGPYPTGPIQVKGTAPGPYPTGPVNVPEWMAIQRDPLRAQAQANAQWILQNSNNYNPQAIWNAMQELGIITGGRPPEVPFTQSVQPWQPRVRANATSSPSRTNVRTGLSVPDYASTITDPTVRKWLAALSR